MLRDDEFLPRLILGPAGGGPANFLRNVSSGGCGSAGSGCLRATQLREGRKGRDVLLPREVLTDSVLGVFGFAALEFRQLPYVDAGDEAAFDVLAAAAEFVPQLHHVSEGAKPSFACDEEELPGFLPRHDGLQ